MAGRSWPRGFVKRPPRDATTLTISPPLSKIPLPMRFRPSPEHLRFSAMVAIFVASGLGITYLLLPPAPEDADKPRPPPPLRVAGAVVPSGGDPVANALDLVRRYATGEITLRLPDGSTKKLRRNLLGAEIDRVRLASFIREAVRPGSAVRRAHERSAREGDPLDVPLPVTIDP